jgi:hypothetical protein
MKDAVRKTTSNTTTNTFWITCLVLIMWSPQSTSAQQPQQMVLQVPEDTTIVQQVELRDGTRLVGRVIGITNDLVRFRTLSGIEIEFQSSEANRIFRIDGQIQNGEFWPEDRSDSRLFLAPTARVPRSGHGYFGVYELLVPSFGVGLGGGAMVSGGFSVIPGLDLDEQIFYVAPKVQLFDVNNVQGAVGLFWVKTGSSDESAGLIFSSFTAGNQRVSFTGGISIPFSSSDGLADQSLVTLGGELRLSKGLKLITENWFAPGEEGALMSFGVRIIGSRFNVEAAIGTSTDGGYLPIVNFSMFW